MKNILLISYLFPPFNSISTRRVYSWAKYLKQLGYNVFVLTADVLSSSAMKTFEVDVSFAKIEKVKYFDLREFLVRGIENRAGNILMVRKILRNILKVVNKYITARGCIFATARMPTVSDLW